MTPQAFAQLFPGEQTQRGPYIEMTKEQILEKIRAERDAKAKKMTIDDIFAKRDMIMARAQHIDKRLVQLDDSDSDDLNETQIDIDHEMANFKKTDKRWKELKIDHEIIEFSDSDYSVEDSDDEASI